MEAEECPPQIQSSHHRKKCGDKRHLADSPDLPKSIDEDQQRGRESQQAEGRSKRMDRFTRHTTYMEYGVRSTYILYLRLASIRISRYRSIYPFIYQFTLQTKSERNGPRSPNSHILNLDHRRRNMGVFDRTRPRPSRISACYRVGSLLCSVTDCRGE